MKVLANRKGVSGLLVIILIIAGLLVAGGKFPGISQPQAIPGVTPGTQQPIIVGSTCGDDGLSDFVVKASYFDETTGLDTLSAVTYRLFTEGGTSAKTVGTTSATGDTSTANNLACNTKYTVILGNGQPNGGQYFTKLGPTEATKAITRYDGQLRLTGDVSFLLDNLTHRGAANVAAVFDNSGGTNTDVTACIQQNVTSGYYGMPASGQEGTMWIFEFLASNFTSVKVGSGTTGAVISPGVVPTNYSIITSGKVTSSWAVNKGLYGAGSKLCLPVIAQASSGVNPGEGTASGGGTNVSLTVYDKANDIQNGDVVFGFVNVTNANQDVGGPNRATANNIRYV